MFWTKGKRIERFEGRRQGLKLDDFVFWEEFWPTFEIKDTKVFYFALIPDICKC